MNANTLKITRGFALALVAVMIGYFATREDVRTTDNPFLVPDLLFPIVLLVGALLPSRIAPPVLLAGFAMESGVILVSFCTHLTKDKFDVGNLALFLVGVVMTGILMRSLSKPAATK